MCKIVVQAAVDETSFESPARDVLDYTNNECRTDSKIFGCQMKGTFNNAALRGGLIVIVSRLCITSHFASRKPNSPYGN